MGLQEKLEAMVKRELYTKYKTAGTPEKRKARSIWIKWEYRKVSDGDFFYLQVQPHGTRLYIWRRKSKYGFKGTLPLQEHRRGNPLRYIHVDT